GQYAATPGILSLTEVDLQQDVQPATATQPFPFPSLRLSGTGCDGTVERTDQLRSVHGLDAVGIRHDVTGLVGLQLADEVHGERRPGRGVQRRGLGARLLVRVLPDVHDAELHEVPDVLDGVELSDDDERDLVRIAPGRRARAPDPVTHRRQVAGYLLASGHAWQATRRPSA